MKFWQQVLGRVLCSFFGHDYWDGKCAFCEFPEPADAGSTDES